jgi:hypothetical protein
VPGELLFPVAGELLFRHDSSGFFVLLGHRHSIVKELEWKDAELYQTRITKSGTTWRSAKRLLKELAWASSFRQRMPLLKRMDRQSNPSQFGDGCKCLIQEREMAEASGFQPQTSWARTSRSSDFRVLQVADSNERPET